MELNNANAIKLTIFAKKRQTKDKSKTFYSYLTRLTNKDSGESILATVKFPERSEPTPDECPCYIFAERRTCNLSKRVIIDEKTEQAIDSYTLWVKNFKVLDEEYEDHSLDNFE